jgi:hypothetical protein
MAKQIKTDYDFLNVSKILNLPNPVNDQDPATKIYVDQLVEGLNWKDNVRAASTGNVNISSPPSTLDNVTLSVGDRILLKNQTTQPENGIYIFTGTSNALSRSIDANSASELRSAVVIVDEGDTNAGTAWRQTQVITTLGTDNVIWQPFLQAAPAASETTAGSIRIATQSETNAGTIDDAAITPLKLANWSGRIKKYVATIGDTTNTVYSITHNLNTKDIHVTVYNNAGNFDDVEVEIRRTSTTAIEVRTSAAPGNNALQVVILG